jgi:hypothetical protein
VITVLQVSDAHLSPRNGLFRRNFARVRKWVDRARPDLVVATGDLSLDGAGRDEDMEFAAAAHHALPAPMLAVPGNHDVGSHARTMPRQPVDGARLARFRRHLGKDRWVRDLPGWRLVGLNSEVMGTGHDEEVTQAAFAEAAAAEAGDRRIALFLHKPVFVSAPGDSTFDYWSVPPHARNSLAPLLCHPGCASSRRATSTCTGGSTSGPCSSPGRRRSPSWCTRASRRGSRASGCAARWSIGSTLTARKPNCWRPPGWRRHPSTTCAPKPTRASRSRPVAEARRAAAEPQRRRKPCRT